MTRKRTTQKLSPSESPSLLDNFYEWVLSLPWVVEHPYSLGTPRVRSFAVDCAPLARRRLWLVTGLAQHLQVSGSDLAVILPFEAACIAEDAGLGRPIAPMPARHVLMTICVDDAERPREVEAIVLSAYSFAMC